MLSEPRPALVAVIEDDDASRHALGRLLQAGGFEPSLFPSAEAFLESPPIRPPLCLIVDVHLTGMSGIDLQRKLHDEGSSVPVIVATAHRGNLIREQAQRAGCAAFLWKPFDAEAILPLLASIARQSGT